jgi:hypothetical protein
MTSRNRLRRARSPGQDLPLRRDVEDHRAIAVPHVDDALHLECDQRLAHRCPADSQLGGELALGWEPIAHLHPLAVDVVQQPLDELLIQAGAADGPQRRRAPPGSRARCHR